MNKKKMEFKDYLNLEGHQIVKYKKKKVILTVTIDEESYRKLKRLIPEGEVSKFAEKTIKESLKKIEEKIFQEYSIEPDQETKKKLEKFSI
jgi:post-segregation antitoxin (ccd killing protein)